MDGGNQATPGKAWLRVIGGVDGLYERRQGKVGTYKRSKRRASIDSTKSRSSTLRQTKSVDDLTTMIEEVPSDDGLGETDNSSSQGSVGGQGWQQGQEEQEWDFNDLNFGEQIHRDVDPYNPPLPMHMEVNHVEHVEHAENAGDADKENSAGESDDTSAIVDEDENSAEQEGLPLSAMTKHRSALDLLIIAREALNDERERYNADRLKTPTTNPEVAAVLESVTREYGDRLKALAKLKRREEDLREEWMAEVARNRRLSEDFEDAQDSVSRLHVIVENLSKRNKVLETKADTDDETLDAIKDEADALRLYIGVQNDVLTAVDDWIAERQAASEAVANADSTQTESTDPDTTTSWTNELDDLFDVFINHDVSQLGEDVQVHKHLLTRLLQSPLLTSQGFAMSSQEDKETLRSKIDGTKELLHTVMEQQREIAVLENQIDELKETQSSSSPSSSRRSSPNARIRQHINPLPVNIDDEEFARRREVRKAEFEELKRQREKEEAEARQHAEDRRAYWAQKFGFVPLVDE